VQSGPHGLPKGFGIAWFDVTWSVCCRNQMRLKPEEHPMMLSEPSMNEKAVREKMVELMFEKYNVPGMHLYFLGIHTPHTVLLTAEGFPICFEYGVIPMFYSCSGIYC
jgi:hypothetical protein